MQKSNQTPSIDVIPSTFISSGITCAATLFLPKNSTDYLPAVLMAHGWGGEQDVLLSPFRQAFNQAGFAVMTFDYATWGKSAGLPRNSINPWQREIDLDNALCHLKNQKSIDARKIILWGSSFGGGHAITLAAQHPSLLGVIAHVPMLNGYATVMQNSLKANLRLAIHGLLDQIQPFKPLYIPIVAPKGEFSTMDRDDAYHSMIKGLQQEKIKRLSYYNNQVRAKSVLNMIFYQPYKALKQINIPTLIIGARHDTVAPFIEKKIKQINNPLININVLEANHFDPYFEPTLTHNLAIQLKFLQSLYENEIA